MFVSDNIIIVTSEYVNAVKSLTEDYQRTQFYIFSSLDHLLKSEFEGIPFSYTLGFCYLNKSIAPKSVDKIKNLLLQMENIARNRSKEMVVIFALNPKARGKRGTAARVRSLIKDLTLDHLKILYTPYEIVTDVLIRTKLIGSILQRYRPLYVSKIKTNYETHLNYLDVDSLFMKGVT